MKPEAERSDVVITSIVLVYYRPAAVLFDPGSTFFYVSTYFAFNLDMMCKSIVVPIRASTPVGDFLVVKWVYRSCVVIIMGMMPW